MRKLGTGAPGALPVLIAQCRVLAQVGAAVALHEREIQGPPGQANDRHINQFLLEEEFQQGDAPVQCVLQHKNVHP